MYPYPNNYQIKYNTFINWKRSDAFVMPNVRGEIGNGIWCQRLGARRAQGGTSGALRPASGRTDVAEAEESRETSFDDLFASTAAVGRLSGGVAAGSSAKRGSTKLK